jgi:hypothetical protein
MDISNSSSIQYDNDIIYCILEIVEEIVLINESYDIHIVNNDHTNYDTKTIDNYYMEDKTSKNCLIMRGCYFPKYAPYEIVKEISDKCKSIYVRCSNSIWTWKYESKFQCYDDRIDIDIGNDAHDEELIAESTQSVKRAKYENIFSHPFAHADSTTTINTFSVPNYFIVGFVDGISEQLDCSSSNAYEWYPHHIVIEAKSRTRKLSRSRQPPLYDQIQLVTYMIMLGYKYGDLVEYVSNENDDDQECDSTITRSNSFDNYELFQVHRVTLHGPPYNHSLNYRNIILPRVHNFVNAIYQLRNDVTMRYQFLVASDSEKLSIISSLCPHLA